VYEIDEDLQLVEFLRLMIAIFLACAQRVQFIRVLTYDEFSFFFGIQIDHDTIDHMDLVRKRLLGFIDDLKASSKQ
jgi:hypothetical protein